MGYLADLLRATFPHYWGEITDRQQLLVALDVLWLAEPETPIDNGIRVLDAAVILRNRIGGEAVLPSYARTLEAGHLNRRR